MTERFSGWSNDSAVQPVVVLYGYPTGHDEMTFLARHGEIVLGGCRPELNEILRRCTGYSTIAEIEAELPSVPPIRFSALVEACFENGILRDSRELFYMLHEDSANPMYYPRVLNPEEVRRLIETRPRTPAAVMRHSAPPLPSTALISILQNRHSTRVFNQDPLSTELIFAIARLLSSSGSFCAHPSAGGLYPLRVYIALLQTDGKISPGLYSVEADTGALIPTGRPIDSSMVARALDLGAEPTSAVAFVTADLGRLASKYANRGYRYALIEAGHAAQNACAFAAEQNFGVLEYGGFEDEAAARLLGLEYPRQSVLITLCFGHADPSGTVRLNDGLSEYAWTLHESLVGPGNL